MNNSTRMTSITGGMRDYLALCEQAAVDDRCFETFKSHPAVVRVMEHVTPTQGRALLRKISSEYPHLLASMETFRANDRFGRPDVTEYPQVGPIAPTTLRYVAILGHLQSLFGDLTDRSIVEIGGGYGGQALALCSYFKLSSYLVYDLPEVVRLQRRYLGQFAATRMVEFTSIVRSHDLQFDLLVSNYAFSEIERETQRLYIDQVVSRARQGYMICDFLGRRHGMQFLSKHELLESVPGSRFVAEIPRTARRNAVLVWGDDRSHQFSSRTIS